MYPMLPVSLDCSFLIAPLPFSNVDIIDVNFVIYFQIYRLLFGSDVIQTENRFRIRRDTHQPYKQDLKFLPVFGHMMKYLPSDLLHDNALQNNAMHKLIKYFIDPDHLMNDTFDMTDNDIAQILKVRNLITGDLTHE